MARDFIKFSNDKKGFRLLLIVEAVVAVWAVSAALFALKTGRTRTMIYAMITVFAAFYILGRSLRGYRDIVRQEKKEKESEAEGGKDK